MFGALLPFLFGLVVSLPLSSVAKKSAEKFGGRVRAWSVFYVICFWSASAIAVLAFAKKIYFEVIDLSEYLKNNSDIISQALRDTVAKLASLPARLPFLNSILGGAGNGIDFGEILSDFLEKLALAVSTALGKIALGAPGFIVGVAVTAIASFYFCRDGQQIREYFFSAFSKTKREKFEGVLKNIFGGLRAYAKAYAKLFFIDFLFLFLGLVLLGRKYSLVIALLLAFFDLLPLFGTAIVLVPWGIVLVAQGAMSIGVGLIALTLIVSAVRQVCEPRFIGKELGIHPLASLATMYIGLRVFGFLWMMLSPIVLLLVKQLKQSRR